MTKAGSLQAWIVFIKWKHIPHCVFHESEECHGSRHLPCSAFAAIMAMAHGSFRGARLAQAEVQVGVVCIAAVREREKVISVASMAGKELTLLGLWASPFVIRTRIALNLEGLTYRATVTPRRASTTRASCSSSPTQCSRRCRCSSKTASPSASLRYPAVRWWGFPVRRRRSHPSLWPLRPCGCSLLGLQCRRQGTY
jgi:hypothetical protein